jgi:hypothetical protein
MGGLSSDQTFTYDVFLSHSSQDKPAVRALAEQLRHDGLRVWLDEWAIPPGGLIPMEVEEGLQHSRVLAAVMTPSFFASDWAALERYTYTFRDPTNERRRFVPLLLETCVIPDMLRQFKYIDYRDRSKSAYRQLVDACRPAGATQPGGPEPIASVLDVAPTADVHQGGPNRMGVHNQGDGAVVAGGDMSGSTIITGNHNNIVLDGGEGDRGPSHKQPAPGSEDTRGSAASGLSLPDKQRLAEALLDCSCMADKDDRKTVLRQVRREITKAIPDGGSANVHILNIVDTCMRYSDGMTELIRSVRAIEGASASMKALDALLKEMLPDVYEESR